MIALDNGPADGDYVRYIDGLIAAARTTATDAAPRPVLASPTFLPMANLANAGGPAATRLPAPAADALAAKMLSRASMIGVPARTAVPRGLVGTVLGLVLLALGFLSEPVRGILVLLGILAFGAGARTLIRARDTRVVTHTVDSA